MQKATCNRCGGPVPLKKNGRPRGRCYSCQPFRGSSGPRPEHRRACKRLTECPECGTTFETRISTQRFCTPRCQRRDEKRRHRTEGRNRGVVQCDHCGTSFTGFKWVKGNRYCSLSCQGEAKSWSFRKVFSSPLPWRDCIGCGVCFYERHNPIRCSACRNPPRVWYMGWCIRDGKPFVTDQPAQRSCSHRCARRYHHSMRRVRRRNAHSEIVHTLTVYERDDWTCRLCGNPVDRDAAVPAHESPTLDHILPLALGGDHTYANIQCAHYICNARKSHTVEGQLYFAA